MTLGLECRKWFGDISVCQNNVVATRLLQRDARESAGADDEELSRPHSLNCDGQARVDVSVATASEKVTDRGRGQCREFPLCAGARLLSASLPWRSSPLVFWLLSAL
jgi:hypothetical protein